jgi:hypothetical protein
VVHPATRVLLCGGYNETCVALGQVPKQWWSVPVACLVLPSSCCHCGVVVVVKYILYTFLDPVYVSLEQPLYLIIRITLLHYTSFLSFLQRALFEMICIHKRMFTGIDVKLFLAKPPTDIITLSIQRNH